MPDDVTFLGLPTVGGGVVYISFDCVAEVKEGPIAYSCYVTTKMGDRHLVTISAEGVLSLMRNAAQGKYQTIRPKEGVVRADKRKRSVQSAS